MDTDSMDTGSVLSTVEQRTHNPLPIIIDRQS